MSDAVAYDWYLIIPTLVGGAISLASSVGMYWLATNGQRRRDESSQLRTDARVVSEAYFCLLAYVNINANLDKHISDCFQETSSAGIDTPEAWSYVPASIGSLLLPNRLSHSGLSFLYSKNNFELLQEILHFEAKTINNLNVWAKYSELRGQLDRWMLEHPEIQRAFDGVTSNDAIPKAEMTKIEIQGGQLNRILASLTEGLAEDMVIGDTMMERFSDAAHSHFGDLFLKAKLSRKAA